VGSKSKLENRVIEGNLSDFRTSVTQIINELEKLKKKYKDMMYDFDNGSANNYHDITRIIGNFNAMLSYISIDDIRNSLYFVKSLE
jgi:flagellar hook-basal body complex protein FliE